jgi:hypothetical protein
MTTPGPTAETLIKQADPFRLPAGMKWAADEEFTPQDQARLDRAEKKRARRGRGEKKVSY